MRLWYFQVDKLLSFDRIFQYTSCLSPLTHVLLYDTWLIYIVLDFSDRTGTGIFKFISRCALIFFALTSIALYFSKAGSDLLGMHSTCLSNSTGGMESLSSVWGRLRSSTKTTHFLPIAGPNTPLRRRSSLDMITSWKGNQVSLGSSWLLLGLSFLGIYQRSPLSRQRMPTGVRVTGPASSAPEKGVSQTTSMSFGQGLEGP